MKRVRFSNLARDDLDEIWLSIAPDNMDAADRFYRSMPYGIAVLRIVYGGRDLQALEYPSLPGSS